MNTNLVTGLWVISTTTLLLVGDQNWWIFCIIAVALSLLGIGKEAPQQKDVKVGDFMTYLTQLEKGRNLDES